MAPLEGRVWNLNSIDHKEYLCSNIVGLLQDNAILDVVLICERESIHAHKLILASCSSFFRLKLLNVHGHVIIRFDESGFPINSADLRSVIDFMYQGKILVPEDRLKDILIIAKFLGVAELLELLQAVDCQINYNKNQNECHSTHKLKVNPADSLCSYNSDFQSGFNSDNSLAVEFDPATQELEVSDQLANVSFDDEHVLCQEDKSIQEIHSLSLRKDISIDKISPKNLLSQSSELNITKVAASNFIGQPKNHIVSSPSSLSKLEEKSLAITSSSGNIILKSNKTWHSKQSYLSNEVSSNLNEPDVKSPCKHSEKSCIKDKQYFSLSNLEDRVDQNLRNGIFVENTTSGPGFSDIACSISVDPSFESSQSLNSLNGSQNIDEELSELTSSIAKQIETENDEDSSFDFRNPKMPIKSYSIQISSILCDSEMVETDIDEAYNHDNIPAHEICNVRSQNENSLEPSDISCDKEEKISPNLSLFSVLDESNDPVEYQDNFKESIARSNISIQTDIEMIDMDYSYPKSRKLEPGIFEQIDDNYQLESLTSIPLDSDNDSSSSNPMLLAKKETMDDLSRKLCNDGASLEATVLKNCSGTELVSVIGPETLLMNTSVFGNNDETSTCEPNFETSSPINQTIKEVSCEKSYTCQSCNGVLATNNSFKQHNWKADITQAFQCSKCPCIVSMKSSASRDLETHKIMKDYQCEECGKKFKTKGSLQTHMKTHQTSDDLLKCLHCDFKTVFRFNLMKHVANLHGTDLDGNKLQATVKCPDCDFVCVAKHMLKSHRLRKHTIDKPFKCQQCQYSSVEKAALEKHVRIRHTHERPYMCEICGFSSHTISGMARHRRSHTKVKPYKCETCGQQYADKKRLRDHMYKHSNIKPFTCDICNYSSRRKDNLQVHRRKTHGIIFKIENHEKEVCMDICSSKIISMKSDYLPPMPDQPSTLHNADHNKLLNLSDHYDAINTTESQGMPSKAQMIECNNSSCMTTEFLLLDNPNSTSNCINSSNSQIKSSC